MYSIDILLGYLNTDNSHVKHPVKDHKALFIRKVIEDVGNLLNSKTQNLSKPDYESILDYGLEDLSYYVPYSSHDQSIVAGIIQSCIERFEPRLTDVKVIPIVQDDGYGKIFRFQITADIKLDKEQIVVVLESTIQNYPKTILVTDARS